MGFHTSEKSQASCLSGFWQVLMAVEMLLHFFQRKRLPRWHWRVCPSINRECQCLPCLRPQRSDSDKQAPNSLRSRDERKC